MISFGQATDAELALMREAIDALALTRPGLLRESTSWSELVHAVLNETAARSIRDRPHHPTNDRGET